jgi:hypothetical protein
MVVTASGEANDSAFEALPFKGGLGGDGVACGEASGFISGIEREKRDEMERKRLESGEFWLTGSTGCGIGAGFRNRAIQACSGI